VAAHRAAAALAGDPSYPTTTARPETISSSSLSGWQFGAVLVMDDGDGAVGVVQQAAGHGSESQWSELSAAPATDDDEIRSRRLG